MTSAWVDGPGVVVLAAYQPDPQLFRVQLESIRDQTRRDWRCLVGADGGQDEIRALVNRIVGDDPRFEVVGWDDNLGFYLNFERLLALVPADAAWVALSDQDDRWYPAKLERLVPLLADVSLATGQAQVVEAGAPLTTNRMTRRRLVRPGALLLQNQITGTMCVFRRSLLELALPFPRQHGITELHDHWLAMCAVTSGGYDVLDDSLQDYVQHPGNVVGEGTSWLRQSLTSFRRLRASSPAGDTLGLVGTLRNTTIGWRTQVLDTLRMRGQDLGALGLPTVWSDDRHHRLRAASIAVHGLVSREVLARVAVPVAAGAVVHAVSPTPRPSGITSATMLVGYGADVSAAPTHGPGEQGSSVARTPPLHVGRPNLGSRRLFDAYVDRIYDSQWLTNDGPLVRELEAAVADRVGTRHCIAMCNGTVALEIAIRAAGLTGEVIVPSFTFVATAHALQWQGLTPVFADIDPGSHTLDPAAVEAAITERTTGIIGVHLWGRVADVKGLGDIATRHGLTLMFDAAHAFGCARQGVPVGGGGTAEVFSFHATKFFNTFEGGAIVTDDDEFAERARLMRNFGFAGYDNVVYPGTNGKMPEISAAMGLTNLPEVDRLVTANRATFELYAAALVDVSGVTLISPRPDEYSNYQYVVAMIAAGAQTRDAVVSALHDRGLLARRYFWPGVHRMPQYASVPTVADLRHTEWVSDRVLVLPGGPGVTRGDVDVVRRTLEEHTRE